MDTEILEVESGNGIEPGIEPGNGSGDRTGGFTEPGRIGGKSDNLFRDISEAFGTGAGAGTDAPYGYKPDGTPKRRPGRPRKDGTESSSANSGVTNIATAKTYKEDSASKVSLDGIEGILLSIHMMLSTFAKIPELELSESEAKKLSKAIAKVASLYDFGASEKVLAWMNLATVMGSVYGTRAFSYHLRTKLERANNAHA